MSSRFALTEKRGVGVEGMNMSIIDSFFVKVIPFMYIVDFFNDLSFNVLTYWKSSGGSGSQVHVYFSHLMCNWYIHVLSFQSSCSLFITFINLNMNYHQMSAKYFAGHVNFTSDHQVKEWNDTVFVFILFWVDEKKIDVAACLKRRPLYREYIICSEFWLTR